MSNEKEHLLAKVADDIHFVSPAGRHEVMFNLYSRLGTQSNILVAATYSNAHSSTLDRSTIFRALRTVVQIHPQLGHTYLSRPSETKKGNHRCWMAQLDQLNLDDCVEFVQDEGEDDEQLNNRHIERAHTIWFNHDKLYGPLWKLIVVNGKHLVFVYEHTLGDGRSGAAFHRSMLEALNIISTVKLEEPEETGAVIDVQTISPQEPVMDRIKSKPSILDTLFQVLVISIIRFWFRRKDMPFSDATYHNLDVTYDPNQRREAVVTKVETLRLDAATSKKCTEICRQQGVTITNLIHTLIKLSLAADLYPQSKFCISNTPTDLRRYMADENNGLHDQGTIMNLVTSCWNRNYLADFRKAARPPHSPSLTTDRHHHVNKPLIWQLSRDYKSHISHHLQHRNRLLGDYKSVSLVGPDDEDQVAQLIPSLGLFQKQCFQLSNLGAFQNPIGDWSISSMDFSAGVTKAGFGPDLWFNVAGVVGGECVIHVNWEEGVLEREMVRRLIRGVTERLDSMIK